MIDGLSFLVPVRNGAASIADALAAIFAEAEDRPYEVIVVDDGSGDESRAIVDRCAAGRPVVRLDGSGRGAAAALNIGLAAARFPIVCQIDQDVVIRPGWLAALVEALDDPRVGAAQGYYEADRAAGLCARVMGFDLEDRYAAIEGDTDHVCTGNTAYRTSALRGIGGFDEALGYGYDNDVSYRLRAAGYRLVLCPAAKSRHRWREGLVPYLAQQYGFGYGRLDLVAKHPHRVTGDRVSPWPMMAHPAVALAALAAWAVAVMRFAGGSPSGGAFAAGAILVALLALERLAAGIRAAARFRSWTPLAFPVLHLARDAAWVAALCVWFARRLAGAAPAPAHSMRVRPAPPARSRRSRFSRRSLGAPGRVLAIIPAHNERQSLPTVVTDVRARRPDLDILVVDDGSTDGTGALLDDLDVRWLRFPERLGIGSAVRAGMKFAARTGYDAAVRLDGDGQHGADEIDALLAPIANGDADIVLGSRYLVRGGSGDAVAPRPLRWLAACLSAITGTRITDPTSGFYAVGPRALRLLAEHHPTGYPEPELRLFLSRNGLEPVEVPVRARSRLAGRTSLTAARVTAAGARVALAMLIVPLRAPVQPPAGE